MTEWLDGEVIVFTPPTGLHQDIAGFLFTLLHFYVRALGLGLVRIAPFEVRLSERVSREPDILFIAQENLDRLTPQRMLGAVDLAVEVVSDDSGTRDNVAKLADYQKAGTPEYWVFDPRPRHRLSRFYRLSAKGIYEQTVPDAEGRYHSAVVPGFWLRPDWLWQGPLPDPLDCLLEISPGLLATKIDQR